MPPINFLTSVIAAFLFCLVARAFLPLLRATLRDFATHAMRGVVIVAVVIVARSGYWDVLQFIAGDHWPVIAAALGGQAFSTVFNIPLLWAGYEFLRARWFLIPEDERGHWFWFTAWAHPGDRCVINWRWRK